MKYEITEKKAAAFLGVSISRISQLIGDKLLDAVNINGKVRISEESLRRYQEESKRPGRPPRTSYATASCHTLMNGPHEVATVVFDSALDAPLSVEAVISADYAPVGVLTAGGRAKVRQLNDWWLHRSIPSNRPGLDAKLLTLGERVPANLALHSMGLSLSDCYWLRPEGAPHLAWEAVNFFDNPFLEAEPEGWDSWLSGVGLSSPDNTSEGELPKKWVIDKEGHRWLLKGCRTDDQRPYNEVVATALYRRLLQPEDYVTYEMVSVADGPAVRCGNFLSSHEEYIPAVYLKDMGGRIRTSNNYDRFCRTLGSLGVNEQRVRSALSKMIVCDVILANLDRHWRNFGFIRNIETLELRPAPLFDTGNSLWYHKTEREIASGDYSFLVRPFGQSATEALAFVDDLDWFDSTVLNGFEEEACEIMRQSRHVSQPGRLEFIAKGLKENIALVKGAAAVLRPRIERQR